MGIFENRRVSTCPTDLHNLEQGISDDISAITPAMLLRVMENILNQLRALNLMDDI
jgi:hypothetical protein